jgi:hypothetical protein
MAWLEAYVLSKHPDLNHNVPVPAKSDGSSAAQRTGSTDFMRWVEDH